MARNAKIAVLVLNYNGIKFLEPLFEALSFLKNSSNSRVVLIDNASADNSQDLCAQKFPWVRYIRNSSNFGWGGGYNQGIKTLSETEQFTHYLLLNNDTQPSETWYRALEEAANENESGVAEWGCRTVFADDIVQETLFQNVKKKVGIHTLSKSKHEKFELKNGRLEVQHSLEGETPNFITDLIPNYSRGYAMQVHNPFPIDLEIELSPHLNLVEREDFKGWKVFEVSENISHTKLVKITKFERIIVIRTFNKDYIAEKIIQNNGIGLNSKFEGYDLLYYSPIEHDFEVEHLRGICGVSKMILADVFHKLNGFDDQFFMYYEDLDFSLRLQKLGHKIKIIKQAVLGHHHGGSSDTQSLFFARQVAWSRLYFQWQHAPFIRKIRTLLGVWYRARREYKEDVYRSERINMIALEKLAAVDKSGNFILQRLCRFTGEK